MKKTATYCNSSPGMPARAAKAFTAFVMTGLLLFLTCINFFLYSPDQQKNNKALAAMEAASHENGQNDYADNPNPAGPDEKSPNSPVSISEEYIHHVDEHLHPFWVDGLCEHMITAAEKLTIVHFELLSPPPEA